MIKRWLAMITGVAILITPISAYAIERYEYLMLGDQDKYVTELQEELIRQGFFNTSATGYFGTVTQESVLQFQQANGIRADAKAGPQTRQALLKENYTPLPPSRQLSETVLPDILTLGNTGEEVVALQQRLNTLKYYNYPKITGYFGTVTQDSVRSFQNNHSLKADGVVGAKTSGVLYSNNTIGPNPNTGDSSATQKPKPTPQPTPPIATTPPIIQPTQPSSQSIAKMLAFAKTKLGSIYVWSDEGPNTFDCSGFVYYVLRNSGKSVPRTTAQGFSNYTAFQNIKTIAEMQPGDIMFFKSDSGTRVSHTGIFLGNGQFIHASSGAKKVLISNITPYYSRNFVNARRAF